MPKPSVLFAQADLTDHLATDVMLAVLAGFAIAAVAKLLVPRARAVSWSTSALLAAIAGAISITIANQFGRDPTWLAVAFTLALTIAFLLIASSLSTRLRPAVSVHGTPTVELVRLGESGVVEFKSTARRNLHTMERDPKIEAVIAKTVCGFLNGRGGTLLIGVDDDGRALGLDADLDLLKKPDTDAFQLFFRDLIASTLGVPAASGVRVRFEVLPSGDDTVEICRVDVSPSPAPVFLTPPKLKGKGSQEPEFWVRSGNGTRRLRIDELLDYHRRRWGGLRTRVFGG
ncbi:MAG: AlbA family DNA-binding domain-containing protein [Microthrixaceae bacterium]